MATVTKNKSVSTQIVELTVGGFKSIRDKTTIQLKPITILAGQNSSGKSSFMQPLLLAKQTLEQPFDAGPISLEGSNVHFSKCEQLFWHTAKTSPSASITFGFRDSDNWKAEEVLRHSDNTIHIASLHLTDKGKEYDYTVGQKLDSISLLPPRSWAGAKALERLLKDDKASSSMSFRVNEGKAFPTFDCDSDIEFLDKMSWSPFTELERLALETIHLPGLRGNPSRSYRFATTSTNRYPGVFQDYFASLVCRWTEHGDKDELHQLSENLKRLELTTFVSGKRSIGSDVTVEIDVGRTLRKGASTQDLVSVADTGLGISQTLPWLVALTAAKNQLVYIEQPEIHLHPRAQYAIAEVLAQYANSGITMVIETHSSLVLLGIQTLVAQGKLDREKVGLNWFRRDAGTGATHVESVSLDDLGRTGKWSYDLTEIMTAAERSYLEASLFASAAKSGE